MESAIPPSIHFLMLFPHGAAGCSLDKLSAHHNTRTQTTVHTYGQFRAANFYFSKMHAFGFQAEHFYPELCCCAMGILTTALCCWENVFLPSYELLGFFCLFFGEGSVSQFFCCCILLYLPLDIAHPLAISLKLATRKLVSSVYYYDTFFKFN